MESLTAEDPPSIGGYELRARLGEGGFGLVYLGLSPAGRAVAVKVLQGEYARDREFLRRFQLEVEAAQRVNGVYTAPVIAAGLGDRPPWLATAFVPGPSLQSVVATNGPLPEAALWRLLAGLVEALQAIHACGLVHRDLKPANVMLAADGPRVIDFGISKALDGTAMTSTGTVFGTPAFMAPEQAAGREVSAATDIFALGCVLAFAATGVPPFGWGSGHSVLYRVVHQNPELGGTAPQLRYVLDRCLAKDPVYRPSLADLASIGRDGPDGGRAGQSPASFWPPQVGKLIRDYQDQLESHGTTRPAVAGRPGAVASPGLFAGIPAGPSHPPTHVPLSPVPDPWQDGIGYGNVATRSLRPGAGLEGVTPPAVRQSPAVPAAYRYGAPPSPYGAPPSPRRSPGYGAGQRGAGNTLAATILMAIGAGLMALGALAVAFSLPIGSARSFAMFVQSPIGGAGFSSARLPGAVLYLAGCGLWLATALAVRAGRPWGRTAGTVFFGAFALVMILYHVDYRLLWQITNHLMFTGGPYASFQVLRTLGGLLAILIGITGFAAVVSAWLTPPSRSLAPRPRIPALPASVRPASARLLPDGVRWPWSGRDPVRSLVPSAAGSCERRWRVKGRAAPAPPEKPAPATEVSAAAALARWPGRTPSRSPR